MRKLRVLTIVSLLATLVASSCVTTEMSNLGEAIAKSLAEGFTKALREKLPPELYAAFEADAPIEIYALYPYPEDLEEDEEAQRWVRDIGKQLHGYPAIAHRVLATTKERREAASLFALAVVQKTDNAVADCFEPRHGMRVRHDGKVHDLVICFACESTSVYTDGRRAKSILVSENGGEAMTKFFLRLGLRVDGTQAPLSYRS